MIVFCQAQYSSGNCSIQISVSPAFQSDDVPWRVWGSKGEIEIEEVADHDEDEPDIAGVALELPGRLPRTVAWGVQHLLHRRQ